jgi:holo-[acyl-carrier protein] synthase
MIVGLGLDMIEVDRVAEKIGKESGFREMIFTPAEIAYCEDKTNKFEHYAARFAAKEAFFKALGTGWLTGTAFNEVEIGHTDGGQPQISLLGKTAETIEAIGSFKIQVSLSHLKAVASAVVILEK